MFARFLKILFCSNGSDSDNESGSSSVYYDGNDVHMYDTRLEKLFSFFERRLKNDDIVLRPLLLRIKNMLNSVHEEYCKSDVMAIKNHFIIHLNTIYLFLNVDAACTVKAINLTLIKSMHGGHYDFCPLSLCQEKEIYRIDELGNALCDCNIMTCICWDIVSSINFLKKICSGNLYWKL